MRTKKFLYNSISTAIYQLIVMIVGFVTPRILLSSYGSETNGLVSSINQFITYFSLVEAGIAGAAVYSLYKPLAEHDNEKISIIVSSAKKFYFQAGIIFTILVFLLSMIYPFFVDLTNMSFLMVAILVFILGAKGFFEFFTLAKYRVLLTADQKTYIISNASSIYIILQMIIVVILAKLHFNIVIVYFISIFALFIRSLILMIYVKKNYAYINYNASVDETTLDKRWDALFLQIVQTAQTGAPIVLATLFTTLKDVSVYSVYNMVFTGINGVLSIFINGLYASFGDIIVRNDIDNLQKVYKEYEYAYYLLVAIIYSVTMLMLMPFISLYTNNINDANYIQPLIGFLFVLNGILYSIKNPQGMLIISAGLYKETRIQCLLQALIIVLGGIALAPKFGLIGILIASCISNLYRVIDMGFFVPKYVTKLNPKKSFMRMFLVIIMILTVVISISGINFNINSYSDWIFVAIMITIYSVIITLIYSFLFEKKQLKLILNRIKKVLNVKNFGKFKVLLICLCLLFMYAIFIYYRHSKVYNYKVSEDNATNYYINVLNSDITQYKSILIEEKLNNYKLYLKSFANNNKVTLLIGNKNLFNGEFDYGFIDVNSNNYNLISPTNEDFRTTKWISLPYGTKYLTLSGNGFNRGIWQFMDKNGNISSYADTTYYRSKDAIFGNKSSSTVEVPIETVAFRVYYAKLSDENSLPLGNEVQIEIGGIPTSYEKNNMVQLQYILDKDESIMCENNICSIISDDGIKRLETENFILNQKNIINLISDNKASLSIAINKLHLSNHDDAIYGIKCNLDNNHTICERIEDSVGLNTNYSLNNSFVSPYENDFDNIYPWSDIKLCNITSDGNVIYANDANFKSDGSNGNVMVEIPKHYIKREVIGNNEYIYISKTAHDGFMVDPSFLTENGEVDKIYVAAYLTSLVENELVSHSGTYPLINISLNEINDKTDSTFYEEVDLLTILTLQRLFLVEMAVLDSQSIFVGPTSLTYFNYSPTGNLSAMRSESNTNKIYLRKNSSTEKLSIGDAITITDTVQQWEKFQNIEDTYQRKIIHISEEKECIIITFSGNPINVTENITQINHIPKINGETDLLSYPTGTSSNNGLHSFKYRYIENLYGSVFTLLNNSAYITENKLHIHLGEYETVSSYELANQNKMISINSMGSDMSIYSMGYDPNIPWLMMPTKATGGGSTTAYFSDFFYVGADTNKKYVIGYGGTWDNSSSAGLFTMRAFENEFDKKNANGSRLILRRKNWSDLNYEYH